MGHRLTLDEDKLKAPSKGPSHHDTCPLENALRDQSQVLDQSTLLTIRTCADELSHLRQQLQSLRHDLKQQSAVLLEWETMRSQELLVSQIAAIFALAKLTESRDDETGGHLQRVKHYCRLLALTMAKQVSDATELNLQVVDIICQASVLHDIGKVGIRDDILLKPGRLTAEEYAIMKSHTNIGATILESVRRKYPGNEFITMGVVVARSHHERWDGTGYPDGLDSQSIPLPAIIMSIADVYDALRSKRCYKEPIPHHEACEIIREGSGTQFDPRAVNAFLANHKQFKEIRRCLTD